MFFGNDFQRKDTEELPLEEKRGPNNGGYDDENDDYVFLQGEVWLDRYTVQKPLGRGSFGTVVQAFDADLQRTVAIKIIKSRESFMNQGKIELRILKYVNQKDPEDTNCIGALSVSFAVLPKLLTDHLSF
jgi:dual specificity tyrosine-phosphorylation-regulated kinase 1